MSRGQLRRAILPAGLLLLPFLFVNSCVPEPITDLRLVEVRRMPASALPPSEDLRQTLAQRGEAVWRVSLMGDANWIEEVKRHQLNSYATAVRCDKLNQSVLSLGPYVGQVPITYFGNGFQAYRSQTDTVRYDIYLPETGRYQSEKDANAPMSSYDLGKHRMALCIRIAGGSMVGAYNRSNAVRVDVGKMP